MKKYRIPIVALTVLAAFSLQTCKHCNDPTNPDCANYDPCYGKKTINTFFKVRPGDRGFPPPEEWCDLVIGFFRSNSQVKYFLARRLLQSLNLFFVYSHSNKPNLVFTLSEKNQIAVENRIHASTHRNVNEVI
jgi:hypothetical protein